MMCIRDPHSGFLRPPDRNVPMENFSPVSSFLTIILYLLNTWNDVILLLYIHSVWRQQTYTVEDNQFIDKY